MSIKINSGVTSQMMDLKTSAPGVTRKEEIKTGFKNVDDYSKYLQKKYSYMNTGTTFMQGVPTTVSVSGAFLQKCMNDPEKAKYLEENLAAIPDCVSYAKSHSLGTLTSISYEIDANGNITGISSGTNDPDGKIARENAERKAKESKEREEKRAEEKAKERRAQKKKAEEKLAEKREEKAVEKLGKLEMSFTGSSVVSISQLMIERMIAGDTSAAVTSGLDLKV